MTDKENAAEIIPRKLSFISSTTECRSRAATMVDPLGADIHTPLSALIPSVNNDTDEDLPLFSNRQIYKNLALLSFAFMLMFTAYVGIISLQSSINTKGNVGVNALIVLNAFILFGSLFLTNITMDILGLKWTIILGKIAYVFYICANIRPTPILMYCAAGSIGLASAPLWASQAMYISRIARYHAHYKRKNVADTVSLFFGIFFAFYGTTGIWGNLISYYILNGTNDPQKFNCGIHFDPVAQSKSPNEVSETTRYVLCGIFAGIGIVSMILLLALDQLRLAEPQPVKQSLKKSLEVVQSLFRWKHLEQLLLVPITMWTMIETGFLTTQFTLAFITCLVGIRFIGLILICNGVCTAIASYIMGGLTKYIGRGGCFFIAATLNYALIILMYMWEPLPEQAYILYIISGVWGVASAVWQSQVIATYTVLYAETDSSVIAKYRLWKAVGSLVIYGYASYASIHLTLIILFAILSISMICYGVLEIYVRWKTRTKTSTITIDDC